MYIDGAFDLFHPGHVEVLKASAHRYGASRAAMIGCIEPWPPAQLCLPRTVLLQLQPSFTVQSDKQCRAEGPHGFRTSLCSTASAD